MGSLLYWRNVGRDSFAAEVEVFPRIEGMSNKRGTKHKARANNGRQSDEPVVQVNKDRGEEKENLIFSTTQMQVDVLMREYCALRDECRDTATTQIPLSTFLCAIIAACITICTILPPAYTDAVPYLLYFLFPSAAMFCGFLWMDQIYRHIRFASYLMRIEYKMRLLVPDIQIPGSRNTVRVLEFEHWIGSLDKEKPPLLKHGQMYGCVSSGVCLILPPLIIGSKNFFLPDIVTFLEFWRANPVLCSLGILWAVVYYTYVLLMIYRILGLHSEADLSKDSTT
ncbi:MAG: hypothetical protein IJT94_07765 [Oscillibacter sp.]|nr:hypothetical protein [Oscillibacter sp.]